jgi:hypothetical protein
MCIPDYTQPTAIATNTIYNPLGYPVWIMGYISVSPPYNSYTATVDLELGTSPVTYIRLFDLAINNTSEHELNTIQSFVSLLVPGDLSFEVTTLPTNPSSIDFSVHLNYYPLLP